MSNPATDSPTLPGRMTWDELNVLPVGQAERIELVQGRPVWIGTGPPEHRRFATRLRDALEACARASRRERWSSECWQVDTDTNVFLSHTKDDFLTPDFVVYRCPEEPWKPIFAETVLIVGEVLSPSNHIGQMLAKQARYAEAGISEYWEVLLDREGRQIDTILTCVLATPSDLPDSVTPLRPRQYAQVGEWSPKVHPEIRLPYPVPDRTRLDRPRILIPTSRGRPRPDTGPGPSRCRLRDCRNGLGDKLVGGGADAVSWHPTNS